MQIILIGGMTGTEKRNALFSLANKLSSDNKKVAVVLSEEGKANDEKPISTDPAVMVRERMSSCVPCGFIFELTSELQDISGQDNFDNVLIEVPFNSLPAELREGLSNAEIPDASFAPLIYVFDTKNLKSDANLIPKIVKNQIMEAEIILLNTDSTDPENVKALNNMFAEMSPDAEVFEYTAVPEGNQISNLIPMIGN